MAKIEDFANKAMKQRTPGKGVIGNLNEHQEPPKLQGMVAVPPYFKELAAAGETEESVFEALGMPYTEPEQREVSKGKPIWPKTVLSPSYNVLVIVV